MTTIKDQRINLRAEARQEALVRQAASASHTSMSEFILSSAVERAERVLADRRRFEASAEQYDEFVALLDAPIETTKLADLFARPSVFDIKFVLDDE